MCNQIVCDSIMYNFELLTGYEHCAHFNALTRRIWGTNADDDIPVHVLVTIAKNGGGLLVARADDGPPELDRMVGMAFWWLGIQQRPEQTAPQLKVCSHMAGVLPPWQRRGVGRALKLKQRALVLEQGITNWMTWTYDPLYRTNGVFNLHRLGAVCNTYARNVYGELDDELNRGTPSDRCQVDWWLQSERVERVARNEHPNPRALPANLQIFPSALRAEGLRAPGATDCTFNSRAVAIPVPEDIGLIRRQDPALGHEWRMYMRELLEAAFAANYRMEDCMEIPDSGWHYILQERSS